MARWLFNVEQPYCMGPTIIGVTYNDGIVLGSSVGMYDMATMAYDINITQLAQKVYVCHPGISTVDSEILSDYNKAMFGQRVTVKAATNLVRSLYFIITGVTIIISLVIFQMGGMIVGGWDKYEGEIHVDDTHMEQPFSIGGSGCSYLYGFFDQVWRKGMTQEEAEKLVVTAVSLAIARDDMSGTRGVCTVTTNKIGATRKLYPSDNLPVLWNYDEIDPVNSLLDVVPIEQFME